VRRAHRDDSVVLSIRLSRRVDLEPFCEFLRGVHVHAEPLDDCSVHASVPGAPTPLHERRELSGYVTTWNALNPGRRAEVV
jgi:hypothetical protein